MLSLNNAILLTAAIVAIVALYLGGQGRRRTHVASALSGAAVVLRIAALPLLLMRSLAATGKTPLVQRYAFIAYLLLFAVAAIVAFACCVRLIFRRARN